jgi:predicted RNA-binding Zn ribbon-like protein
MTIGSSQRMGLDPAPGGLGLVQDLVNTSLADDPALAPDLLATLDGAQAWLGAALAAWSAATRRPAPEILLAEADLEPMRVLREQIRALLRRDHGAPADVGAGAASRIELALDTEGVVAYQPIGRGWKALAGLVYAELWLAQAAGTRERLKTCDKPTCRAAFYDRSRNSSRVWHDTKMCGNAINLRASRARPATRQ